MILKNVMEDAVFHMIDYLREYRGLLGTDQDACFCTNCSMDIAAIALNRLQPKYVVTDRGEALAKAERFQTQFDVDVLGAVVAAIRIVKNAPRHCALGQHVQRDQGLETVSSSAAGAGSSLHIDPLCSHEVKA